MDIQKLREEFEKLPHIADKLESIYFCENLECYIEKKGCGFCGISSWVNGAWHTYQKQQKIIDENNSSNQSCENQLGQACVAWIEKYNEQQKQIDEIKATAESWINQDYTHNSDSTDIKIQQMKDCGRDIIRKINGELK